MKGDNEKQKEILNKLRSLGLSVCALSELTEKSRTAIYNNIDAYCSGYKIGDEKLYRLLEVVDTEYDTLSKKDLMLMVADLYPQHGLRRRSIPSIDYRLDNKHANYVNFSVLTPEDRMIDGKFVEDRSDEVTIDDQKEAFQLLDTYTYVCEEARSFVRSKVEGKYAWFSDSQKSFIAHYDRPDTEDNILNDYSITRHRLEFVKQMLESWYFTRCPLNHVSALLGEVEDAIAAIKEIEQFEGRSNDDMLDAKVKELNEKRRGELSKAYTWYVSFGLFGSERNPGTLIEPFAKIHNVPYDIAVSDYLDLFDIEHSDRDLLCYAIFGPFHDAADANKVMSYLEVEWEDLELPRDEDAEVKALDEWMKRMVSKKSLCGIKDSVVSNLNINE